MRVNRMVVVVSPGGGRARAVVVGMGVGERCGMSVGGETAR